MTVRAEADEKRQHQREIARQALGLAETNVDRAMDLLRDAMPDKFLAHSSWYERATIRDRLICLASSLQVFIHIQLCLPTSTTGSRSATDKYLGTKEINVRQPAVVLLNPEDAGSLLAEPITVHDHQMANYWKKRATVYIMGSLPDEYFYKRASHSRTDNDNVSSSSSMSSNEQRLGEADGSIR
ncbi:unnamed protein product [Didymodactylos carnosus]|uniref:Uncharacterized protein n=1 Tax=Didymodactylos carnosus TaxID=1234261 RepID=A0A8S2DNE6_9BILA|nr:unnamed protein product [Didymodactylos carnosus]CAF3761898.1 unnamed protein product [Didymodactylos carnosus]